MFDKDTLEIVFSVVISLFGLGYCSYGRKNHPYYLLCGLGLLFLPFFVETLHWLFLFGCLLILLPYLLDR